MKYITPFALLLLLAAPLYAIDEPPLEETPITPWHFSIGPRYRFGMKTRATGIGSTGGVTPSGYVNSFTDWEGHQTTTDPVGAAEGSIGRPLTPAEEGQLADAGHDWYIETITGGASSGSDQDDHNSRLGITAALSYDFYLGEDWVWAAKLSAAGYWNMKSEASLGGGSILYNYYSVDLDTSVTTPPTCDDYDLVSGVPDLSLAGPGTGPGYLRIKSHLWQIGIGPELTYDLDEDKKWHLWLNPEFLFNLASIKVTDASGSRRFNEFTWGIAARAGVRWDFYEDWFLTGSFGYEYIREITVETPCSRAKIDFSSFTVTLALGYTF